ncbi:MAG TPA: hypothetical protein VNO52_14010 [Methylomirabilota bacterium]|nr:hypothetical protein [Methylomirabilota bacterium]
MVAFSRGGPGRIRIDSANPSLAQALNTWPATAVSVTRGSQDIVFPEDNRLTITNVIVSSTNYAILPDTPATISLPAGSNVVATVAIAARGRFYGLSTVPLAVVVAPENGASSNYNAVINLAGERGGANVTVTIPAGTSSTLHVWTHNN